MKKHLLSLATASLLCSAMPLSPLASAIPFSMSQASAHEENVPTAELAEWTGQWNSLSSYLDDEEMKSSYEVIAKREGVSADVAKEQTKEHFETPFSSMDINASSIIFYKEKFRDDLSKEEVLEEVEYSFVKAIPFEHVGVTYYWFVFETESDSDMKQIALMDVHGEETLAHFHMLYDAKDVTKVIEKGGDWLPTFVRPDAALEMIQEEIEE